MAIEILGLREVEGQVFFERNVRAPKVHDVFLNPKKYVEQFTEEERFNLFFTLHDCEGVHARQFKSQYIIPFDIDKCEPLQKEDIAKTVCETLGVAYNNTGIMWSGHGLWLLVEIEDPIINPEYFMENRELYKLVCMKINNALETAGLSGKADPAVFSPRRLARMPETWNRKPGLPDVLAYVMQPHIEQQNFSLVRASGAPELRKGDFVDKRAWKVMHVPDVPSIEKDCGFLAWSKANQPEVTEEQWHAVCGIVGFFPDGEQKIHDYSKEHPKYSYNETAYKVSRAKLVTGPRTCESISKLWEGCKKCPFYTKITTPMQIVGDDFVATENTGFYRRFMTPRGVEKIEPDYEGLVKFFRRTVGEFFSTESGAMYVYHKDKKYWKTTSESSLEAFAYEHMDPKPRTSYTYEFAQTIKRAQSKEKEWMNDSTNRKLNLQNGVLDLETGQLFDHGPQYGFMGILPYSYDPDAKAPLFLKFLDDVTEGNKDLATLLLQFAGYAISGDRCWYHKALILIGSGRNGKSTFNDILKELVGPSNYSTLSLTALNGDQKRAMLEGKLVNFGDENNPKAMIDSEMFKSLVAGEEYDIKEVYKRPYTVKNKTKMIFNCNNMPNTSDRTHGYFSRLLFAPFNARFTQELGNVDTDMGEKLKTELPGILNLVLSAYEKVLKTKKFIEVEASLKVKRDYEESLDTFEHWFSDRAIVTSPEERTLGNELYNDYVKYCEANNYERFERENRIEFGRKLSRKAKSSALFNYKQAKVDGKNGYYFYGIKIGNDF